MTAYRRKTERSTAMGEEMVKASISRRDVLKAGLVASAATVAGCRRALAAPDDQTSEEGTRIVVDAGEDWGRVSPLLFGANHRYGDAGNGSVDPSTGEVRREFIRVVKKTGVSIVRFPAGTMGNLYRWKRAIGPLEERGLNPQGKTSSFGVPLTNEYGVDEHAQFMEKIGGQTNVVVNFATGTAKEAADWVEYMNAPLGTNPNGGIAWAEVRAANGHPEPYGVRYWEVGNEMHFRRQRYWMGGDDPTKQPVEEAAEKYVFGGITSFTDQLLAKPDDYRDSAAASDGSAGQSFVVKYPPVHSGSETVKVAGETWTRVGELSQAGSKNVYTLDVATGKIEFGDGSHGNIPMAGASITISYVSGPHEGFVDYYRAMKSVDPTILVCSGFEDQAFTQLMGSEHPYDGLAVHPYSGPGKITREWVGLSHDEIHDQAMLQPAARADEVRERQRWIERHTRDRRPEIVITEYGMWLPPEVDRPDHFSLTVTHALYGALFLIEAQQMGLDLVQKHSLVQWELTAAHSPLFTGTTPQTSAHVLRLFAMLGGSRQVAANVGDNPARMTSSGEELSALVSIAARDAEDNLRLIVVNRDREADVTATVATRSYQHAGSAVVHTLNGPTYTSYNTPDDPKTVSIFEQRRAIGPGEFRHTFPAHSVTEITLMAIGAGSAR